MSYCDRYDGAVIYGRGQSVRLAYRGSWTPKADWRPHRVIPGVYWHPQYSQMVWVPTSNACFALHRAPRAADVQAVRDFASFALGGDVVPQSEIIMPTALRLPLRPVRAATPPPVARRCRCAPLWPRSPHVVRLHGVDVEFRVSATRDRTGVTFSADALLGRQHVAFDGRKRAIFFPADAGVAPTLITAQSKAVFFSSVLFDLVHFGEACRSIGLEVDPDGRRQLPVVARVKLVEKVDDITFDVRLPTSGAELAFAAFFWGCGYAIAPVPGGAPSVPEVA